jgi:hypothetical protein
LFGWFLKRISFLVKEMIRYKKAKENPPLAGLHLSHSIVSMRVMNEYGYHLEIRLEGKYKCSIYRHGIPLPFAVTDDYEMEEEAIEAAKRLMLLKKGTSQSGGHSR